jgi:glutathione peroxidase-family protein
VRADGEKGVYDFTVMQYGKPVSLDKYRGKVRVGVASALRPLASLTRFCSGQVTVVVNVASE